MVNWGEASLFWMLIYKATFLPSTKHHLLGYFFHEMTTFRSAANKSPTRIQSARCVWESTSSFHKPTLILLQVHSKEGSPKNSNPVNTFVRSLIRKLTLKESWPVCAGQMWKVNFTTWTVCTLGQETSLGTMWPESDLVGSWDLGTREYFFKEPPPSLTHLLLTHENFQECLSCVHHSVNSGLRPRACPWVLGSLPLPETRKVKFNLWGWEEAISEDVGIRTGKYNLKTAKNHFLFFRSGRNYS